MADLRHQLIIDLSGNLQARATAAARGVAQIGQRARVSMAAANRAALGFDNGLSRLGNRYTALFTGAAAIGAVKSVGALDDRMRRLGIESGKSGEEVDALKARIFEVANMPDIRLDPDQLIGALEEVQSLTGDLDFGAAALRDIGLALQGTGAQGKELGKVLSTMNLTLDIRNAEDVKAALAILIGQGKEGSFVFKELAGEGPAAMAAIASSGRKGVESIREMGAVLQALRPNFGSAPEVVTAYEAFFETLKDGKNIKFLAASGIDIWEDKAKGTMKSFPVLVRAIMERTGGDVVKLGEVFSETALKSVEPFANEWRKLGALPTLDKFLSVDGDFSQVTADSARAAEGFGAALQSLTNAAQQFANTELSAPVSALADAIGSLDPSALQEYLDLAKEISMVGGGLVAANAVARNFTGKGIGQLAVGGVGRLFGKGKGKGGVPAAAAAGLAGAGATPVVVTNWPVGFGAGGVAGAGGKGKAGGIGRFARTAVTAGATTSAAETGMGLAGKGSSALKWAGRAARRAPWLGTLLATGQLIDAVVQGDAREAVGAGGSFGGALAGGATGAALGSVVPVFGTAVGGLVGAGLGAFGGEELAKGLYDAVSGWFSQDQKEPTEVGVDLHIEAGDGLKATIRGVKRVRGPADVAVEARTGATMGGW